MTRRSNSMVKEKKRLSVVELAMRGHLCRLRGARGMTVVGPGMQKFPPRNDAASGEAEVPSRSGSSVSQETSDTSFERRRDGR
ncbi:hypothetical protein E2C01_056504 [Portunus trituberculatus]|uniref:Uncharacterized protein n=1 Tax=Portunus trituberculatus TaxID=210409 RepID=A0A5B7GXV8_PORTR|nr:hypothetical protein [Portunus trituberculatus]